MRLSQMTYLPKIFSLLSSFLSFYILSYCNFAIAQSSLALPKGEVFVPNQIFKTTPKLDRIVIESNPRIFVSPQFEFSGEHVLIVGLDGWGGRSENFIDTLRIGLDHPSLNSKLIVAAIQDPVTRGPRYQGQGDKAHANVWKLQDHAIPVMQHFITRIAAVYGPCQVFFMGYSTGSVAAPLIATQISQNGSIKGISIRGAISLGTGSYVSGTLLKTHNQRVLFLVVPPMRAKEAPAYRYDQGNRTSAEGSHTRIIRQGGESILRHVESARRHIDWHWGLMSQCRYFRSATRLDKGRGYWPHYWLPNPDTFDTIRKFISNEPILDPLIPLPETKCPFDPNP